MVWTMGAELEGNKSIWQEGEANTRKIQENGDILR